MISGNGKDISDTDDFNEALNELIHRAVTGEVDVEGGWDVGDGKENLPEFTVEIYRMDD